MSWSCARAVLLPPLAIALLALAACRSAPIQAQAPEPPPVPVSYRYADHRPEPAADAGASRADWWQVFADPTLDQLERRALDGNPTIQIAAARLAKARAVARTAHAARAPQAVLRAGASRQAGPLVNAAGADGNLLTAVADFSYEVDLFGRLQQAVDAATLDAQSQQALLAGARLLVQAEVARTYLALRALDAERTLLRATAAADRDTMAITEQRFHSGSVAELEWVRVRAELASVESEALVLDRRRTELEHALALLVGETASAFELAPREWTPVLPAIPPGLPAAILDRRPDVWAAQRAVEAAQLRLGQARDDWLPGLTLSASAGSASPSLVNLLQESTRTWGVAALLALPLFDGGRRAAGIQIAQAELDAARGSYREQLLVAWREVEDQLATLRLLSEQVRAQATALDLGRRVALLADSRYASGLASQLDVLDARRSELRARRETLQLQSAQYQASVGLVRALGGGWNAQQGN